MLRPRSKSEASRMESPLKRVLPLGRTILIARVLGRQPRQIVYRGEVLADLFVEFAGAFQRDSFDRDQGPANDGAG